MAKKMHHAKAKKHMAMAKKHSAHAEKHSAKAHEHSMKAHSFMVGPSNKVGNKRGKGIKKHANLLGGKSDY